MNRKRLLPYQNVLEELGVEFEGVEFCRHLKIRVRYKGTGHFFFVPISGSDTKGVLNFRQDVRRWMRGLSDVA